MSAGSLNILRSQLTFLGANNENLIECLDKFKDPKQENLKKNRIERCFTKLSHDLESISENPHLANAPAYLTESLTTAKNMLRGYKIQLKTQPFEDLKSTNPCFSDLSKRITTFISLASELKFSEENQKSHSSSAVKATSSGGASAVAAAAAAAFEAAPPAAPPSSPESPLRLLRSDAKRSSGSSGSAGASRTVQSPVKIRQELFASKSIKCIHYGIQQFKGTAFENSLYESKFQRSQICLYMLVSWIHMGCELSNLPEIFKQKESVASSIVTEIHANREESQGIIEELVLTANPIRDSAVANVLMSKLKNISEYIGPLLEPEAVNLFVETTLVPLISKQTASAKTDHKAADNPADKKSAAASKQETKPAKANNEKKAEAVNQKADPYLNRSTCLLLFQRKYEEAEPLVLAAAPGADRDNALIEIAGYYLMKQQIPNAQRIAGAISDSEKRKETMAKILSNTGK